MLRVAIQVKELISSNVTSAIESASDPVKMLNKLQREIEESIIALQGDRTLASQRKSRLEGQISQLEMREADWSDKAKIAMDHDREDLARQALMAREDCRETLEKAKQDVASASDEMADIDTAIGELEAKREETRAQVREMAAARASDPSEGPHAGSQSKADRHRSRISELEKRTEFATEDHAEKRTHASIDNEIDAMRRESTVEAELEALKSASAKKSPAKKRASKKS